MNDPLQVTPLTIRPASAFSYDLEAHGTFTVNFSVPGVTPSSVVMASMTEVNSNGQPFVGDATTTVHNVAPGNGNVRLRGEVGWSSDLSVRVYLLVN
ncbi:hypothetical protein [Kitasatospora griseola]|uniref:hypothetical protein n=1 Tax=Kitasatospora griseola TaxID=2064 RepID=UPI0037FE6248